MTMYSFTREEAVTLLATVGISPEHAEQLAVEHSLHRIAKEHHIGFYKLRACFEALSIELPNAGDKIARRAQQKIETGLQTVEQTVDQEQLRENLAVSSLQSVAKKYNLPQTWLTVYAEKHRIPLAQREQFDANRAEARKQQTDQKILREHEDKLRTLLAEDTSVRAISEKLGISRRVLNRLIPQLDSDYLSPTRSQGRKQESLRSAGVLGIAQRTKSFHNSVKDKYQTRFSSPDEVVDFLQGGLRSCIDLAEELNVAPSTASLHEALEELYGIICDHELHGDLRAGRHILQQHLDWSLPAYDWHEVFFQTFETTVPAAFSRHPHIWATLYARKNPKVLQWIIDRYSVESPKALTAHIPGFEYVSVLTTVNQHASTTGLTFHGVSPAEGYARLVELFKSDQGRLIEKVAFDTSLTLAEYRTRLELSVDQASRLVNEGVLPRRRFRFSTSESQVQAVLEELNITYQPHVTGVLPNKREELDFYLPDHNLAIEVNPTYTHNSTYGWGYKPENALHPSYHQKKVQSALTAGITLIMLYEKDLIEPNWSNITVPFLRFKTKGASKVFYGRQILLRQMDTPRLKTIARDFLAQNHSQGTANANHYYGFYTKAGEELVGVASFTQNTHLVAGETAMELKRLAFAPAVQVRFGLSKLVKRFFTDHGAEYSVLYSYSRNDMGQGDAYEKAGFEFVRETPPTLTYVNPADPYDSYSWALNSPWGARSGVLSRLLDEELIRTCDRETLITKHLPRRTGNGLGYVAVHNAGNRLWKYQRPSSPDKVEVS